MSEASVTVESSGPIAHVRITNPGKRNAFTWRMYDQLEQIALTVADDPTVRVVVLRGSPEDGFAAGTDITQFDGFDGSAGIDYERRVGKVLAALAAIPVPTIAAVERTAVGAGLAVAAYCDLIIAEPRAKFGAPIARTLGNTLPAGVVNRLRIRIGAAATLNLLLTASLTPAENLVASGFVYALAGSEGIEVTAAALAEQVAALAPLTLRAIKELNRRLDSSSLPDDTDLLELCYGSADFREGVRAFVEHRRPEWTGTP
ncbi:enoyl-CoA hydratase [Gryllotalpicola reticulitermitis]|uniref:Enoyl-CoA hydratase n=1 Tax=Gryllotalpicola reticulitermitis TaxID=1184153 RepID=A0ABV8QAK5_9MICO